MKRIDQIKNLPIEKLAGMIVALDITSDYCQNDCEMADSDEIGCPRPVECCIRWLNEETDELLWDIQQCRVCGCTDDRACPGGCYWVEEDLCSCCAEKM